MSAQTIYSSCRAMFLGVIFSISLISSFFFFVDFASAAPRISVPSIEPSLPFIEIPSLGGNVICHVYDELNQVNGVLPSMEDSDDCAQQSQVPAPASACSNGVDDDSDGFTDEDDPNCHSDGDPTNTDSYDPNLDTEDGALPVCWNGVDDDSDGLTDMDDPGCLAPTDDDETDPSTPSQTQPQCSDGIDNDEDGLIDTGDPGCSSSSDDDETDPSGGGEGGEDNGTGGDGDEDGGDGDNGDDDGDAAQGGGGGVIVGLLESVGDPQQPTSPTTSCDQYLTDFIRTGRDNDETQVRRLQYVLQNFESAPIEISGIYDAPTLSAVHTFQSKYASDILTPWGVNASTGYVYLTTRKKVNEIYCQNLREFPLTTGEQQIIDQTRQIVLTLQQPAHVPPISVSAADISVGEVIPPAVTSVFEEIGMIKMIPAEEAGEEETLDSESQLAGAEAADTEGLFTRFGSRIRTLLRGVSRFEWVPPSK